MTDTLQDKIATTLHNKFSPLMLEIINESHYHVGHREAGQAVNSHFRIRIASAELEGLSRVKQHQAIYRALDPWMHNNPIHALAIEVLATTSSTQNTE